MTVWTGAADLWIPRLVAGW